MDALKRAEESKQDAARSMTRGSRHTTSELALEPVAGENATPTELPELADHIQALDAELAAAAPPTRARPPAFAAPPEKPTPQPPLDANQETARNVFTAKQAPALPSRTGLWLSLGVAGIAAAGIAGYFYFQLSTLNHSNLAGQVAPPLRQVPAPVSVPPQVGAAPVAPTSDLAPLHPADSADSSTVPAPFPARANHPPAAAGEPFDSPAPPGGIRFKRNPPAPDPNVARGYAALQGNTLDKAEQAYEQALRSDPKNVDALLGLAAIAQRQGRQGDAERLQQLAYEADPKDSAAQAAVVATATGDTVVLESRLRNLLANQPESPPLNFALGILLSRQNRWAEAQQAYFNAVAGDGDNPDFLFNLAVSLDHLRQPKLAAQHYRMALEAAERRPATFDLVRVQKRLQELQP